MPFNPALAARLRRICRTASALSLFHYTATTDLTEQWTSADFGQIQQAFIQGRNRAGFVRLAAWDSDLCALTLSISLRPLNQRLHSGARPGDVFNIKGHQLGSAQGSGKTHQKQRPIAFAGQIIATGPGQLLNHAVVKAALKTDNCGEGRLRARQHHRPGSGPATRRACYGWVCEGLRGPGLRSARRSPWLASCPRLRARRRRADRLEARPPGPLAAALDRHCYLAGHAWSGSVPSPRQSIPPRPADASYSIFSARWVSSSVT